MLHCSTRCEDLPDALVHPRLARADLADAREQLVEVVRAGWPLQALVIQREPLDDVLFEAGRRPSPELRAARRPHAVADREHDG